MPDGREESLPVGARVALLAASACVLFAAVATTGTVGQPYAPNDWSFSHVLLADRAVATGHIPFNQAVLQDGEFAHNHGRFASDVGLDLLTFYASTVWHFWNGLPLHPSLVATLALATGLSPEATMRLPLGGVALVLLAYASAALVLAHGRGDERAAPLAPFALAVGCAPFALDMRVLMPSTTVLIVGVLLHATLRRLLAGDRVAILLALVSLLLLPFWYYTVSYFVIVLLLGFVAADVALRLRFGRDRPVLVPTWAAIAVCAILTGALLANGALTSHIRLATQTSSSWLGPDAGSDYATHLNRRPWRSALLYGEVALLFAPVVVAGAVAAWRFVRGKALAPFEAVLALWGLGALGWSSVLLGSVGVSFLNRTVIYLAPVGALGMAWACGRSWDRRWVRWAAAAGSVALLVATTAFVATATPRYRQDDARAYAWVGRSVPAQAVVYAPLEVGSVLFRDQHLVDTLAFYPLVSVLDDVWYSHDPERLVPYIASFDYLVVRHEMTRSGFEEFGPLRQPIDEPAYAKFAASPDLDLVYENSEVQVFRVALRPALTSGGGAA